MSRATAHFFKGMANPEHKFRCITTDPHHTDPMTESDISAESARVFFMYCQLHELLFIPSLHMSLVLFLLLQVTFQLITPTNSYTPFCVLLHFHDKCIQTKSVALPAEQMIAKIIHNHNNSKCTTSVAASQCGYY